MSPAKRRGLGRGLDALLTSTPNMMEDVAQSNLTSVEDSELQYLPIEQLQQGKYQPRKDMSSEALEDLSNSIRSQGIIQPIVVRNVSENSYEIIAVERRSRAAQLAEIDKIPCII